MNGNDNCKIDLNAETKIANVTITMKRQKDIAIKEDIAGKVEVIIGEEKIIESFDLQILNEEKADEEAEIYYKEKDGEYKKLESDNITAEGDGSYTIWFKINGIDENNTVFAKVDNGSKDHVFSYSNGSYKKGLRFIESGTKKVQICVSDVIIKEITINLTIKSNNKHLVLYGVDASGKPNVSVKEETGWDRASVINGTLNQHKTNGEEFFLISGEGNDEIYFCFKHGDHLPVNQAYSYYILYDAQEYEMKPVDQLILAFLGEVTTFTEKNGTTIDLTTDEYQKYGVQQFYIWGEVLNTPNINYGIFENMINELKELPNGKNKYIDVNNMTITVNGETKRVAEFKATQYVYREQLDANEEPHDNPDGKGTQPLFKYEYKLEDGPGIQLKKVDENGSPLSGIQFKISKKTEDGKWEEIKEDYETNEEGVTETISLEDGEYLIRETNTIEGYVPSNQYVILTVENGEYKYEVREANKDNLDENGYVKNADDGTQIAEGKETDWNSGEVEANGSIELQLVLTNKPGTGIKLKKVDETGEKGLEATFEIYVKENENWKPYLAEGNEDNTYTTDRSKDGETDLIPVEEGEYLIIEQQAPNNYIPTSQYAIVKVDENGEMEYQVYEVDEKNLTEKGYVTVNKVNGATEVSGQEAQWESGELEEGIAELELVVKNKHMPSIKIKKVDENGQVITGKGGNLHVTVKSENSTIYDKDMPLNDGEKELTYKDLEKMEGNTYTVTIKETEAPQGYEIPEKDTFEFQIVFKEESGWSIIPNSNDPDFFEATVNGNSIDVKIKNIKKKDLELKIQKTGGDGEDLSGVRFQLNIPGLWSGTLTGNQEGHTIKKEQLKPGTYTATLTETNTPQGYKKLETTTFTIQISDAGAISVRNSSNTLVTLSTQSTDDKLTIVIRVVNVKEKEEESSGTGLPLIMSISGKVWLDQPQGKNSQANGQYDSGDKLLKDIQVELYESDGVTPAKFADKNKINEELGKELAQKYLTSEQIQTIKTTAGFIPSTHITKTNEAGQFSFVGLDPAKTYTVIFRYNGMRYQEIMASIDVEGSGITSSIQTTAKAVENSQRRDEITNMFKEINPAPNNYANGLVFTQTEVEEYIQNKKLPKGVSAGQMEQFINDTMIDASISGIGNILSECEGVLKGWNAELGAKLEIASGFVFPVVRSHQVYGENYLTAIHNDPAGYAKAQGYIATNFTPYYLNNSTLVGYKMSQKETWNQEITYRHPEGHGSGASCSHPPKYEIGRASPKPYYSTIDGVDHILKADESYGDFVRLNLDQLSPCLYTYTWQEPVTEYGQGIVGTNDDGSPIYGTVPVGSHMEDRSWTCWTSVGISYERDYILTDQSNWTIDFYYVEEGYHTEVEEDSQHCTRLAVFSTNDEPLFDTDNRNGKSGIINGKWGWQDKLTGYNDNDLEKLKLKGNEGIGKLYQYLWQEVRNRSPKDQDLCVVYRPTVDLGLYDDVMKAIVTINNQTETYVYDKRAANGKQFQFGVNEFDIQSGRNVKGSVEEAYAEYYQSLSDGNPFAGESNVTSEPYEDIGIRKEDVNINMLGDGSITTNGSAIAGFYNDYDVNIEMVYRIQLFNESAVSAHVTNIIDYYMDTFEIVGVYADKDCTMQLNLTMTDVNCAESGYNAKNIQIGQINLPGNSKYEIFIKLRMKAPKETLGGDVLDAGYQTYNYAEINGYGTNIGVIDIDSSPGDLIPEGRFKNGKYDDDESRSPSLTYKNPVDASRKISGIMFEDETGKTQIQSYVGQTREGDGKYSAGTDRPVIGAKIKLIEVQTDGITPVNSSTNPEPGLRCETTTDANGHFQFDKAVPTNYIVVYEYGHNYETVLTNKSQYSGASHQNEKSYNGESFENTKKDTSISGEYWYANVNAQSSYATDDSERRTIVTGNFADLNNDKAQVLNSYKDLADPNIGLVDRLINEAYMFAKTDRMLLDVEYHPRYPNKIVQTEGNGTYTKTYVMDNINFGIVERERAELEITKKVSYISIVDSAGKEITGGTYDDWMNGNIKYVKWISGEDGFVDMEIDKELLSGATLKITYEISVANTSEAGNTISSINVIDYVSNNLNYDVSYENNSGNGWTTITSEQAKQYVNNASFNETGNTANKIDLSTYQTILMTTFDSLAPNGIPKTKTLTLEKNLSPQEDSNFNYENQVEIVRSHNGTGRGDYSSIYGNLDPMTYTSRQGDLHWDYIGSLNENGYPQQTTVTELDDPVTGDTNAMRLAEKDSGNAEEVIITPPTGAKGIVLQTYHYVLALIALVSLAGAIVLIKKYVITPKE